MGTVTSPARIVVTTPRPAWRRSLLAAVLGVIAGGLSSAAILGLTVVLTWLVSGDPVEDSIGNALEPLGIAAAVPIAVAVWVDALCRREVFWVVTGWRPSPGTTMAAALLAPAAAVGIGWRGGVVAYVLGLSTVLLRCCAEPAQTTPREYLAHAAGRPRAVIVACVAGAVLVIAAGLAAFQLANPALESPGVTYAAGGVPTSRDIPITNRALAGVTVLGVDGPLGEILRIGGPGTPIVLQRGETRMISLVPAPSCTSGEASFSALDVRYRVAGIERISSVGLGGEVTIRC